VAELSAKGEDIMKPILCLLLCLSLLCLPCKAETDLSSAYRLEWGPTLTHYGYVTIPIAYAERFGGNAALIREESSVKEEDHTEATAPIISPEMEAKKEPKETNLLPLILSALCFMISACLYAMDLRRKERR
jgi:hypothetical protein